MHISPEHELLQYCGRIDFDDPKAPLLVFPCSFVRMRFTGNELCVRLENRRAYWDNYMGYILDGEQGRFLLPLEEKCCIDIQVKKEQKEHEILLFKRMDACHVVRFLGFSIGEGESVLSLPPLPSRKIEVYGDSVSAGEVSEAVDFAGKEDPEHNGEYSNSWHSYAWITARKLNARIHDIAQGGIALMDGTGWFCEPDYMGMESVYDKICYRPDLGEVKKWDFSRYRPQVVVIAIGQNDSHPVDFMKENPGGEMAVKWKTRYKGFVEKIRGIYPKAVIILATTVLNHAKEWDEAIGEAAADLKDDKVYHFLYKKNGCGTPGHIRIPEAEEMAEELAGFIEGLGEEIWD
ncbi:MAG: GDSL-type esterase/lipase family protein [Roseburia sp.]|nr:GDSL-type esterase/lipase family protein [Roseburia sp.]